VFYFGYRAKVPDSVTGINAKPEGKRILRRCPASSGRLLSRPFPGDGHLVAAVPRPAIAPASFCCETILYLLWWAVPLRVAKGQYSRGDGMPGTLNFKKVGRTIKIFAVAQLGLIAMLVFVAIQFQAQFRARGGASSFMQAVMVSFVIQMALLYPIFKFSSKEAERDLALTATNLSTEEVKALTKKKRFSDMVKLAVFCFFSMFILQAPNVHLVLSVLYFSFILTILTYLQCYNFAAKKLMRQHTAPKA
jgi:Mn2+/Fe2+ NRAMP family transporter